MDDQFSKCGEVSATLERSLYLSQCCSTYNLENGHGQNNLENGVNRDVTVY